MIRLLFACGMSFSFRRLCSFVYTGARRKCGEGEPGLGHGLFTRWHRCSLPSTFTFGCVQLVEKRKEFQMSDGRDAKTKLPEPLFLPRLCFSSFLVLSAWVRRGEEDGVTHCPLFLVKYSSSAKPVPFLFWRREKRFFFKTIVLLFCRYIPGPDPISGCCHCTGG